MYLIMVYDVGVKRVAKVLKTARKYLTHIQNSVLEGELTPNQFRRLQKELHDIIDVQHDAILFYTSHTQRMVRRQSLGRVAVDPEENILD